MRARTWDCESGGFKMKSLKLALAGAAFAAVAAGAAQAATIDYIFTGTGTGSLNGTAFNGDFTVTVVSDTTTAADIGGGELQNIGTATFVTGSTTATLTGDVNSIVENTGSPGYMSFAQITSSPFNVAVEALTNSVFETYDLTTALPLTSGGLSVAAATYYTSAGDLNFNTITALSFQATVAGVPEPSTWAMMLAGFVGLGFLGYRQAARVRSVRA